MDILSAVYREASPVFNFLKNCPTLRIDVTYKKYKGQEFSESVGANVNSYTHYYLQGIETFHTKHSAFVSTTQSNSESSVEVGDRVFFFFSGVPIDTSLKDIVEVVKNITTYTYGVKSVIPIRGIATIVTVDS